MVLFNIVNDKPRLATPYFNKTSTKSVKNKQLGHRVDKMTS